MRKLFSLIDILVETGIALTDCTVRAVDIGANPIDGDPPYKPLLQRGAATVIGFEPNPAALAALLQTKGGSETYLPNAIGDGTEQTLNITKPPGGMSSMLEPNRAVMQLFHGLWEWSEIVERVRLKTTRLDDIAAIESMDYLKMDVQGAELQILQHGVEKLKDAVVVHSEVIFLEMYKAQPTFSDIDLFLRQHGFCFQQFTNVTNRVMRPFNIEGDRGAPLSQWIWADAVFIRDLTRLTLIPPAKLLKFAIILHDLYRSVDAAYLALTAYDKAENTGLAAAYAKALA